METVTVVYHHDSGSWWADSPQLEGFSAAADSFTELRAEVRGGVAFYLDDAPHSLDERFDSGAYLNPVFATVSAKALHGEASMVVPVTARAAHNSSTNATMV